MFPIQKIFSLCTDGEIYICSDVLMYKCPSGHMPYVLGKSGSGPASQTVRGTTHYPEFTKRTSLCMQRATVAPTQATPESTGSYSQPSVSDAVASRVYETTIDVEFQRPCLCIR